MPKIPKNSGAKVGTDHPPAREAPADACCRICYESGGGVLFKPCRCDGTMKWVHVGCLDTWREKGGPDAQTQCQSCGCRYRFSVRAATVLNRQWVIFVGCTAAHLALAAAFYVLAALYYPNVARLKCVSIMYGGLGWVWMGLDVLGGLPGGPGGRWGSWSSRPSAGGGKKDGNAMSALALVLIAIGIALAAYKVYTGVAHLVRKGRDRVQQYVLDERDWAEG